MSNPAYLWLTDANGSPINGNSLVTGRNASLIHPCGWKYRETNWHPYTYTNNCAERI